MPSPTRRKPARGSKYSRFLKLLNHNLCMKGLSTTILIVVSAVVILVAALVVLAIFSGGIKPVTDFSQAKAICMQRGASVCSTLKALPNDWYSTNMLVDGNYKSCSDLEVAGSCKCDPVSQGSSTYVFKC
jgi:hypothetical protein